MKNVFTCVNMDKCVSNLSHIVIVIKEIAGNCARDCGCGIEDSCHEKNLGQNVLCLPCGSFLVTLARIYPNGENHGKLQTARSKSAIGD